MIRDTTPTYSLLSFIHAHEDKYVLHNYLHFFVLTKGYACFMKEEQERTKKVHFWIFMLFGEYLGEIFASKIMSKTTFTINFFVLVQVWNSSVV